MPRGGAERDRPLQARELIQESPSATKYMAHTEMRGSPCATARKGDSLMDSLSAVWTVVSACFTYNLRCIQAESGESDGYNSSAADGRWHSL